LADFVIFNECPTLYGLFAIAAYVIKMQLKKKRGSIVCYDTPFFNLSEFYQVAMIILLPE